MIQISKGLGVDGVLGGGQVGHMDGDVVAQRQHVVQVHAVVYLTAQVPCGINGDVGVVAVDLHAQLNGAVGHAGADGTQTDDTQRLALDLVAHELLLALFHGLCHGGVAGQALTPLGGRSHIAAAGDQHTDHQLGHSVGVGTGGVEHHDALLAAALQRDVVHAGTGAGDGQQIVVEGGIQHVGAADEDAVRGIGVHSHVKLLVVQLCQTHRADGVQSFDGVHSPDFPSIIQEPSQSRLAPCQLSRRASLESGFDQVVLLIKSSPPRGSCRTK